MTTITFKGQATNTVGVLPKIGDAAPDFTAVDNNLSDVSLSKFRGKNVVLNIFPSLDTSVCAKSVVEFNRFAANQPNVAVLCLSMDLPFAQKRFCEHSKANNVIPLSLFRSPEFGKAYGVTIKAGPLRGLMSRAVVVIDEAGKVIYNEQVSEIAEEPNYENVRALLNK